MDDYGELCVHEILATLIFEVCGEEDEPQFGAFCAVHCRFVCERCKRAGRLPSCTR